MVLAPVLLVAAVVVKLLPALVLRLAFGWREALSAGALLSARLSLIIAASAIGMRLGVISESVNTSIILIAIITVVLSPMVFVRLAPQSESAKPRPMVVVGAGELGLHIAEQLRAHHEMVVVVDPDETRVARARQRGLDAIVAQAELPNSDVAPFLEEAQAVLCTLMDTELNYRVCQLACWTYGIDHVIAQVNEPNEFARFEQLGVRPMHAAMDRAALFVLLARNPAMYGLLTRADDDKEVSEVEVCNGALAGKTLRQLTLPGDVLVLALRRDGELVVPHGNTQIGQGDHLTLVGLEEHVERRHGRCWRVCKSRLPAESCATRGLRLCHAGRDTKTAHGKLAVNLSDSARHLQAPMVLRRAARPRSRAQAPLRPHPSG